MYQSYIFDLYGTLVDIHTDESGDKFWSTVAEVFSANGANYTTQEIEQCYHLYAKREHKKTKWLHPFYRHIEINLENVFKKLYHKKGVRADKDMLNSTALKFRQASTIFINLYDGALDLLQSLKNADRRIYLLSNAQRSFTYPELVALKIVDYFDGILISSDCACKKPQKAFFDMLIRRFDIDKSKAVMIGNDCISDMEGAYFAGIDSLYIHQDISTPLENNLLRCNYSIMDGDVTKIKQLLLKSE